MDPLNALLGILFIPLLASLVIVLLGSKRSKAGPLIAIFASIGLLLLTLSLISNGIGEAVRFSWEWFRFGDHSFELGFLFDNISATMLAMIAVVGLCITIFSLGYMSDDQAKGRFFAGLSFFMFSMLGIVLADNLIMVFVFWELVGFSSYMLIGHYFQNEEAKLASKKAFIVNRIGDFGFLLGILLTFWQFGTTNIEAIAMAVGMDASTINTFIGALLICGFIGKSAQFPLHVWLPDAMAGPTPVSALIHAATMVAAGIYLLIRIDVLLAPSILTFIAYLGAFVALFAGFCAYAQNDIKRILAYSTLSQLGYMASIFGLGFPGIALFHLITHAFFKALLFLGAGAVIHACHHEQSIFKMGGLYKKMPTTTVCFIIGTLALCGVYGFSGFYSKDAILIASYGVQVELFYVLLFGALMTAGYMGRLVWTAFFGKANSEKALQAHEVGFNMLLPLIVLAIFSIFVGLNHYWPFALGGTISADLDTIHHMDGYKSIHKLVVILGSTAWILGLLGSLLFYGLGNKEDLLQKRAPSVFAFLKGRLWIDEIYSYYVNKIQRSVSNFLNFFDIVILRGILIRGGSGLVGALGVGLRMLHVGKLNAYSIWFLFALLFIYLVASGTL
ncbi:MAG: NADH-quinone oxidoreductase subunit L [Coraliomargaritaceae bacterium]